MRAGRVVVGSPAVGEVCLFQLQPGPTLVERSPANKRDQQLILQAKPRAEGHDAVIGPAPQPSLPRRNSPVHQLRRRYTNPLRTSPLHHTQQPLQNQNHAQTVLPRVVWGVSVEAGLLSHGCQMPGVPAAGRSHFGSGMRPRAVGVLASPGGFRCLGE